MLMAAQPDSPAVLVQTTHSKTDFLSAAQLKNVGDRTITGYRIGWVVVFTSGKSEVTMGRPTNVPAGINPGEIAEVDAQGVSPRLAEQGAATVLFFVTDIHLANSKVWKADIKSIRQEA